MPRNPMLQSGRDAQNIGVNRPDRSAEPKKSYIQHNNDFDLSYSHLATLRYADVHPFFAMDALPADKMPFRSFHQLRSYTLQSPMMSDINMHKSFTMVPMQAILPNTWERFIVNPTKGDDVPDDVYCNFKIFDFLSDFRLRILDSYSNDNSTAKMLNAVRYSIILEMFLSSGSLLSALGIDVSYPEFDNLFDTKFIPFLKSLPLIVNVDFGNVSGSFTINEALSNSAINVATYIDNVHDILDCLRDGSSIQLYSGVVDEEVYLALYNDYLLSLRDLLEKLPVDSSFTNLKFDISKLIAYQLSCVQIMTDDSVDDIYTADLFRNLVYEYTLPDFFQYNGNPIQYDAFSEHTLNGFFEDISVLTSSNYFTKVLEFFTLLFSFRKSLKFGDYFIDARPEPYSVGDMTVEVKDGAVSAIDTTKSILAQRFRNWSNRVGNKLDEYILALTGEVPTASVTEAKYIVHETFDVSGFEVENTGAEQRDDVSVTTQLKTQDSRYMFDIEINDYCIILGLAHFDVKRIYTGRVDRSNLKTNRFDFFNKFFQYAGDQDIMRIELSAALSNPDDAMAYTTRHMQYKTAVSQAVGGFANGTLPSWAFVNDESQEKLHGIGIFGINSDFIRNHNGDFDRFYSSLTGYSLGNYFHFIVKFENIVKMSRQMAIAPDIL